MTGLRLRVFQARIEVGPFQFGIHEVHHARDVASVVRKEGFSHDPLVLIAHLKSLATATPASAQGRHTHYSPKMAKTASRLRPPHSEGCRPWRPLAAALPVWAT